LRERLDADDEPSGGFFTFNVGDRLIGELLRRQKQQSPSFGEQDVAHIRNDDTGAVVAVGLTAVLVREFDDQKIVVGDRVAIRRLPDLDGKRYKRFKVIVEHAEIPF
jgi:hypothetical protein